MAWRLVRVGVALAYITGCSCKSSDSEAAGIKLTLLRDERLLLDQLEVAVFDGMREVMPDQRP